MSREPATAKGTHQSASAINSPTATRDKILRTATPLFEAHGAAGTTIRQIAAAAEVNSQLIYYYFGDKNGLFRAVLEEVASRVGALLTEASQNDGNPRDRLARFIVAWVKITLAEAPAVRLLHRAMLEGNAELAGAIQRHSSAHAAQIAALIEQGIANGIFRADLDPRYAVASLVGMVQYLALAEPILSALVSSTEVPKEPEAVSWHTAELFLRGLDAGR